MRRSLVVAAVAAALVLSTPATSGAAEGAGRTTDPADAAEALATVQALLDPEPVRLDRASSSKTDLSLAMRDLFVAVPQLDAEDQRTAQAILARPTDGAGDPAGDGYTVPARKKCGKKVCIHWVTSTSDAAPSMRWVNTTLRTMGKVWTTEVGRLGYRKPVADKRRGGNPKLDVYLKELGNRGIYGYCTPEQRVRGHKWLASGYCVLDNDFARSQFGAPPMESLKVTAAHEFFHAVQFGYDYGEDRWMMEATATWMEERFADSVNDNRQYLPYGQVGSPGRPLDTFNPGGFNQYGNWPFFEYLSNRFGAGIVRQIWSRAGAYRGSGHQYSTAAVKSAVAGKRGGFTDVYRRFAAANTVPSRSYPEGGSWPVAASSGSWTLSSASRQKSATTKINHMSSRNYVVRPANDLRGKRWRLHVAVNGPARKTAPAAYLVMNRKNGLSRAPIGLSRKGNGGKTVSFDSRVTWAKVVVVNASTRFSCWHRTSSSCQGRALDNNSKFTVKVNAFKKRR